MTSFDFRSIRNKILFFGGIALLLVAFSIIGYAAYSMNTTAVTNANNGLVQLSQTEAGKVSAILEDPMTQSQATASALKGIHTDYTQFPRDNVISMIHGVLNDNPSFNGVYTIWEPGMYDIRDNELALKDGYDKTGRLRVYWYRDANGTQVRKLYDSSTKDPGSYYDIAKKTMKTALIEPYVETMQGSPILMASTVSPILIDNKFAGIVAIDVAISDMQKIVDSVKIYNGKGIIAIVSNEGIIAGLSNTPDAAGKNISEKAQDIHVDPAVINEAIKNGKPVTFEYNGYLGSLSMVNAGNGDKPWGVIVLAPRDVVTAEATAQTVTIIIIGVVILCLGLLLLYWVSIQISRPIENITKSALIIAKGDLSTEVSLHQNDEIGKLADAFREMISSLNEKSEAAEKIARGEFNFKIPLGSEEDVLGKAMIRMKTEITEIAITITSLSEKAAEGQLKVRGEEDRFSGEFKKMVSGINNILDAVINPLHEAMRLGGEYSVNNFGARFSDDVSVTGDFVEFKDSMNGIGIQVSQTLKDIQMKMNELLIGAEAAQASSDDVAVGASTVANNAQSVSHFAEQGSDGVLQVLKAMEDLSTTVSSVSIKTEQIARFASESNQLSTEGAKLAKSAESGMEAIRSVTLDMNVMMNTIKEQMEQINSVVGIITGISDETNLLALNAAIEAARAGDAGLGFAVVADEVKDLAMESRRSAERIEDMIQSLQQGSQKASDMMEKASKQVSGGYDDVLKTLGIFEKIVDMLSQINNSITEVAAASEEEAASVEEITASIHEVSDMIRQTSDNALSSSAVSEESSAAVDQIRKVIENVNQIVSDLQKEIMKFTF